MTAFDRSRALRSNYSIHSACTDTDPGAANTNQWSVRIAPVGGDAEEPVSTSG